MAREKGEEGEEEEEIMFKYIPMLVSRLSPSSEMYPGSVSANGNVLLSRMRPL